jgi:hypothetical protein
MKTDKIPSSSNTRAAGVKPDHSKLVSLLALAAGAAAMPQTSNADIIYTESGAVVSWDNARVFNTGYSTTGALPGNVQLGFNAFRIGVPYVSSTRFVTGGARGSGYLRLRLNLVTQPLLWADIPGNIAALASFGSASDFSNTGGFGPAYMAFEFKDSTQAGTPMRYGWVGLSMVNGNLISGGDYPRLTVSGWAYDNTGAQIPMGATAPVPEPSAMGLLALGALTLGAQGVRSWRRNRAAASQS